MFKFTPNKGDQGKTKETKEGNNQKKVITMNNPNEAISLKQPKEGYFVKISQQPKGGYYFEIS